MKKILIIAVFIFTAMSFTEVKDSSKIVDPDFCWMFANAVEKNHCGYVGCDYDTWEYAFGECLGLN